MWCTTRNQSAWAAALMNGAEQVDAHRHREPQRTTGAPTSARARTTKSGFPGGWGMPRMWPVAMYSLVSQNAVVRDSVKA